VTVPILADWIVDGPTTLHGYDDDLIYMLVRTDTDDPELERQIALVSTWDIEGERYAQMIAAVPRLLAACQAVVDCWECGDLAEAARMCADAVTAALGDQPPSQAGDSAMRTVPIESRIAARRQRQFQQTQHHDQRATSVHEKHLSCLLVPCQVWPCWGTNLA
jgi:hypothetical protein